jgi:hypothetical protein
VMANELMRWDHRDSDGYPEHYETDTQDDNEQWDLPPDQPRPRADNFSPAKRRREGKAAEVADRDAADAHQRGDTSLAFTREGDAAEHRQSPWDWGDFRTWAIIVGLCVGIMLFSAFVYFMPQGRHNQNDGPEPTPTIRVY